MYGTQENSQSHRPAAALRGCRMGGELGRGADRPAAQHDGSCGHGHWIHHRRSRSHRNRPSHQERQLARGRRAPGAGDVWRCCSLQLPHDRAFLWRNGRSPGAFRSDPSDSAPRRSRSRASGELRLQPMNRHLTLGKEVICAAVVLAAVAWIPSTSLAQLGNVLTPIPTGPGYPVFDAAVANNTDISATSLITTTAGGWYNP